MRLLANAVIPFALVAVLLPSASYAQASIAGVVRDSSGAVLPGVTVEAASPALIEKMRSTVTDGNGAYRVEELRPGAYTITYTLSGFSTVKREGIQLSGTATTTVNVDLRVGDLRETITVTGQSPTVDVQNTTRQRVVDHDVIDALPTARNEKTLAALIPGVSTPGATVSQDVGGTSDFSGGDVAIHGGRTSDQRITQNGLSLGTVASQGSNTFAVTNMSALQEVTIDTSAVSAEMATGGVRFNFIPKEGGNTFSGTMFAGFANESLQGNNFTDEVKATGLGTPDALRRVWDFNPGFGGPVLPNKLWFYTAYKNTKSETYPAGVYLNLNAHNPDAWTYVPDRTSRPFNRLDNWDLQGRLTWQATDKIKIGVSSQDSDYCACSDALAPNVSPEAALVRRSVTQRNLIADWTAPLTNRLLIDGGIIYRRQDQRRDVSEEYSDPRMISVTEQALDNLVYRTVNQEGGNPPLRTTWYRAWHFRTAASYVTGTHALKVGFNTSSLQDTSVYGNQLPGAQFVSYRFNNGVPNRITLYGYPMLVSYKVSPDMGAFVQDKWTIGRLTASYGLRYDLIRLSFPDQTAGPTVLLPTRNVTFPASTPVKWHDISPKAGLAYDLFGNAKTALKVSLNKYLEGTGSNIGRSLNPLTRIGSTTTRSWADADRDYVPDCDLVAPGANGECAAMANQNFGGTTVSAVYDPDYLRGWGRRAFNWEFSAGVQHEIFPRVSVDVSYFRRWYGNFVVTDNRATAPSDYTEFSLTAPVDPQLPTSGQVIGGYFNLNPNKVGQVAELVTFASNYGEQRESWNGVDVLMNARLGRILVQGGTSTGRTTTNSCAIRTKLPETALTNPFCETATPFLTQVKLLAAYTVPRVDVQVSGTMTNVPGPVADANFVASNAYLATNSTLGRPLSGGAANITVSLIEPNSLYIDRVTQVDLRIGKIIKLARTRASVNLDIYNALNGNDVLAVNRTYGGATPWLRPQAIMQARLLKFSAQLDF